MQVQAIPVPPLPPLPPLAPQAPTAAPMIAGLPGQADAPAVYQAYQAQRTELGRQLESLEGKRRNLSEELQNPMVGGADKRGLEQRITDLDQRIANVDKQIAAADAQVAQAAAIPGAAVQPPDLPRPGPPDEVYMISALFIVVVFLPLSVAWARRIWRRGVAIVPTLPRELFDRLTHLEQAVDAVALEMERVGEGQRYVTSLFTEGAAERALGAGAAEPVEVRQRARATVPRD